MKFGDFPLDHAEGTLLAHTLRLDGRTLKKGHRLSAEDLALIAKSGRGHVTAARLESNDIHEDEAAAKIAERAAGFGLIPSPARTGRCNLTAGQAGLVLIDADQINAMNKVDEAATIATLSPFSAVAAGEIVATIKIIPFAVASEKMDKLLARNNEQAPLSIKPFGNKNVGLVLTRIAGGRESIVDKAAKALEHRLDHLGLALASEIRCAHVASEIAQSIHELAERGSDVIVVAGAAATVDRKDAIPAGIEISGGTVTHFGMPVEPGNLLVLGDRNGVAIVGMPGCARSIKTNGFDWVLNRVLAGIDISRADIMAMGVGGLIGEKPSRSKRLKHAVLDQPAADLAKSLPHIAAIVLAAGQSRRMGAENKLLADFEGVPLVRRAVQSAERSKAGPIIVVTGHEEDAIKAALEGIDVTFVHASNFENGMSQSLIRGIEALPDGIDGAVICLGDMPAVRPDHIDRLIAAFDPQADAAICVPTHKRRRGNPILWSRQFFEDMKRLHGDIGARGLLKHYANMTHEVEMDDPGILMDIDKPDDLTAAKRQPGDLG